MSERQTAAAEVGTEIRTAKSEPIMQPAEYAGRVLTGHEVASLGIGVPNLNVNALVEESTGQGTPGAAPEATSGNGPQTPQPPTTPAS
jgi:hypothetical protein